jgi:hypothetical protein
MRRSRASTASIRRPRSICLEIRRGPSACGSSDTRSLPSCLLSNVATRIDPLPSTPTGRQDRDHSMPQMVRRINKRHNGGCFAREP